MLTQLTIRNVALIAQSTITLGPGFTVLTGETGAGKSMLLDALGLALGNRAETAHIRQGEETADVTASFRISQQNKMLTAKLEELGLEPDENNEIHLRRQLKRNGEGLTSRAWVNGTPTPLATVQTLGEELVDLHAQHAAHALLNPATQRNWLDTLGGLEKETEAVREAYHAWGKAKARLAEAETAGKEARRSAAEARRTVEELEALNYQPGEEETLENARHKAKNAAALLESLAMADSALNSPEGALVALSMAEKAAHHAAQIDTSLIQQAERLTALRLELADAAYDMARVSTAEEGQTLESIEDRLHAIKTIARRYGVAPAEIPTLMQQAQHTLQQAEEGSNVQQWAGEVETSFRTLSHLCRTLTARRFSAAAHHSPMVNALLSVLHLPHAQFEIRLAPTPDITINGAENIEFFLSTNPGNPLQPLSKVASGGELSRLMLAIKLHFSKALAQKTIILDESDTGLGGAAASSIGFALKGLGGYHQVLAITHHPQVAAYGNFHMKIHKDTSENQTETRITQLEEEARKIELARMVSGMNITPEALAAAAALREEGQKAA